MRMHAASRVTLAILCRSSDNRAVVKYFINDAAVSSAHNLVARQVDRRARWSEVRHIGRASPFRVPRTIMADAAAGTTYSLVICASR